MSIACEGRYVPNCTGLASSLVDIQSIGVDGMPEQGTELLRLCPPCTVEFLKKNPEAVVSSIVENINSRVNREKEI